MIPINVLNISSKQAEYIREAKHRWNFKIGATQCGKTYIDTLYVIPNGIIERKGKAGLNFIAGVSKGTIQRNIIEPMQELFGNKVVTDISSDNTCRMFGEKVYCLGADNIGQVRKFRGARVKFLYIDEVVDICKEVFEILKSRLSFDYSIAHASGNPQSRTHYIKAFIESNADVYVQHYTLFDNQFLPKEFIKQLCLEHQGTVYYNRYVLGQWCNAEGLIFMQIANDRMKYETNIVQLNSIISIGIDWGGNGSSHSITATKISRIFSSVQVLASDKMKATGTTTTQIYRWIINFIRMIQDKYGTVSFLFCDSAEQVLNNSLNGELEKANILVRVSNSIKTEIKDRIELINRLLNLERLSFIKEKCNSLIEALQTALYDDKAKDDRWIDDGKTSDIDSLDSFVYSFENWFKQISYQLGRVA